jgi:phage anti-repressor protein|tara:strand:- start:590 stop:1111 length:522 start_codon:yes stop_codon:yes gene_type:complete
MIQVIDNFLDQESFLEIKKEIFSDDFPWYFSDVKSYEENNWEEDELYNCQHVHTFFAVRTRERSGWYSLLIPILKRLKARDIIRIKVNSTPKTERVIKHNFHVDIDDAKEFGYPSSTTTVYYLNTNDGYTEFETGERVNSVENRMVIFDSTTRHRSTTCTNQRRRVVLNFNYI